MHIFTAMKLEDDQIYQICHCNRLEYGQEFKCINHFGLKFDVINFSDLNTVL